MTHEGSLTTRNLDEGQLVNGLALLLERTGFRWREQASRLPSKRQVQDLLRMQGSVSCATSCQSHWAFFLSFSSDLPWKKVLKIRMIWILQHTATAFLPMPCILSRRLTSSRPWIIKASRIRFTTLRSFNARHTPGLVTSEPNSLISFRQLPIALTCRAGVDFPSHVSHYVTMLQSHRNTVGSGH